MAETNLHQQLKRLYVGGADRTEHPVGGFRIDAVRHSGDLIEVQTANFAAIRPKLAHLLAERRVILVHPICETRYIVKADPKTGEPGQRRRSPRRGNWLDAFDELVHLTDLLSSPNLTVELLLTEEEERRYSVSGGRSRRRNRFRSERRLIRLLGRKTLKSAADYLAFLPDSLESPFTTRGLALSLGAAEHVARQIAYCLREMGLLKVAGKIRNNVLYVRRDEKRSLTGDGLKRLELRELRRSDWRAYEARIRDYYGERAAAVLDMEDRLAELAELLRDTEPDRAETLLEREKYRLRRPSPGGGRGVGGTDA